MDEPHTPATDLPASGEGASVSLKADNEGPAWENSFNDETVSNPVNSMLGRVVAVVTACLQDTSLLEVKLDTFFELE
jgi:hypothetical protein